MDMILKGKAWIFGDNLSTDEAVLPYPLTRQSHDPKMLKDHVMTGVDREFPKRAHSGDIIVAGRNFGHGNPHIWGYLAMREMGIGLITESMARGGFRMAVAAGVPFLPEAKDITKKIKPGDELEVDFRTGMINNLTRGEVITTTPLPEPVREIIEAGGQEGFLRKRFASGTQ